MDPLIMWQWMRNYGYDWLRVRSSKSRLLLTDSVMNDILDNLIIING